MPAAMVLSRPDATPCSVMPSISSHILIIMNDSRDSHGRHRGLKYWNWLPIGSMKTPGGSHSLSRMDPLSVFWLWLPR